ncbi:MAG: fumarylacetoacetase [Burkholderiales bacterium]|nr:fumarylacetoacetase [Burkholderiales bacterium]
MHPNHPSLQSFITVDADSDFPIQNLPFGIFSTQAHPHKRVGVAIGNFVLDLAVIEAADLLRVQVNAVFNQPTLNSFIALGKPVWQEARKKISELLRADHPRLRDDVALRAKALIPMHEVEMHMPIQVSGYTDFYSSREHATNVGMMFRDPANALLPNWLHLPVGYNGRASSVVVSGTEIRRPMGQVKAPTAEAPSYAACAKLDFELEMAFIVGTESQLGQPIKIEHAHDFMFGMVLLNDWSARDIQQWEYVPLGPFNAKTFATSISPWVVTMDALEPFFVDGPKQEPEPLSYLQQSGAQGVDIALEVSLQPQSASQSSTISRTNFKTMYWSMAQQLAHHTVSGCNVNVGDLMASGTVSGSTPDSYGSLLELSWNGQRPLQLEDGQSTRSFLEDGDEVTMRGWCQGKGYRVGFGEVKGRISPAKTS